MSGLARRVIAATAPTAENMWAKLLTIERRIGNMADANGIMRYTAADGNSYALGSAYHAATGTPQTITSTTGQVITGLSHPVIPGITYGFDGILRLKQGGTANIGDSVGLSLSNAASGTWYLSQSDGTTQRFVQALAMNAFFASGGATPANAENCILVWGTGITTSVNDTLQFTAKISTVNFVIQPATFFRVYPT